VQTTVPLQITAAAIKVCKMEVKLYKQKYASATDQINISNGPYFLLPLFAKPLRYDVKQCQQFFSL